VKMSKPHPKQTVPTSDVAPRLREALAKRTKGDLIEVLVKLAKEDHTFLRALDAQLDLEPSPHDLVAATRQAIADATAFDERDANQNFRYDYAAYEAVKRNFSRLIDLGQLGLAMELSLELMDQGSHQVEMSDEGLMTEDIEACLGVVIKAVEISDLPLGEKTGWCAKMLHCDRVGCICDREFEALRKQTQTSAT
jgi:uncharacterized Zn finger protein